MKLDIRALATEKKYDIITTNAILYGFDELGFSESISSIASALNPEGYLIAFDFFHPWKQEVSIIEKTGNFPEGHPLHFRSYDLVQSTLKRNGFDDIQFKPFSIGISISYATKYGEVERMKEIQRCFTIAKNRNLKYLETFK